MIKPNYSLNSLIFFNIFLLFLALISLDSIHARTMQRYSDNKVSEDDYNAGNYSVSAVCSDKEAGDLKVNKNGDQTTSTDKYSNHKAEDTGMMEFKNVKVINRPQPPSGSSNPRDQGMVVEIDRETGKFIRPSPGKIPPPRRFSESVEEFPTIELKGGGVAMPAPPSTISYTNVTIDKDSKYKYSCTNPTNEHRPDNIDGKNRIEKDASK